ncbi:protein phosphatase 2C domain-containing protein, partial [Escherichia coli]|uniref:protein phosphatase 2C domain-containing protein n=1 Tax=Escherichia coli TaxID=562 RepID=UPI000B2BF301
MPLADEINPKNVQGGELGLNDVLATDIVLTIRQRLFAEAEAKELAVRDFACTFLGLISSANGTLIMQIGDGGVVV